MLFSTVLSQLDADDVASVMESRTSFLSTSGEQFEMQRHFAKINMQNILDPHFSSMGMTFGVWSNDGDRTKTLMGVIFTLFSSQQPCYFLNKAYTCPTAPVNTLAIGLKKVMEHHESLGYKRFYALYSKTKLEVYKKLWHKSTLLQGYDCYTDYESAPDERPKFQEFWELLYGRMLYKETMIVRAFVKHE